MHDRFFIRTKPDAQGRVFEGWLCAADLADAVAIWPTGARLRIGNYHEISAEEIELIEERNTEK